MRTQTELSRELSELGFSWLPSRELSATSVERDSLGPFAAEWGDLAPDPYLDRKDTVRSRRYARYMYSTGAGRLKRLPHGPYFQRPEHNPLFGGRQREFAPLPLAVDENPYYLGLINLLVANFPEPHVRWFIQAHMVRISATDSHPGKPSPEGQHRDGSRFISVHLLDRQGVSGGETSIYDGDALVATETLSTVADGVVMDDRRMMHHTSPIVCLRGQGHRDVLLMSFDDGSRWDESEKDHD